MDEREFVQRCIKGDKQSWDVFLTRYSRLIYSYIYQTFNLNGHRYKQEEIEDIYQEIFCSLIKDNYRKLSSYQGRNGCSLASWLRQVVINSTLSYLRKLKNTAVSIDQETEEGFSLKEVLKDISVSAQEFLADAEKLRSLEDCIELLDADDQYFAGLFLDQGLGLSQIKEHLGLNRGALYMRKSRILRRLRDCFKSKGFELDFAG